MPRKKKPKKRVSTGKERKDFAIRMLVDNPNPASWAAELKCAKDIFAEHDLEFLLKVAKPPFKINSLFFFKTEDGRKYLERKFNEFNYKPKRYEIIKGEEKVGEDWNGEKKKGLMEFLKD